MEFLRHLRTFPDDVDLSDLQEEIGFQYGTDQGSNSDVNSPAGGVEIDPSSPSLRSNWHPALQISARSPGESQMQWTVSIRQQCLAILTLEAANRFSW